MLLCLSCFHYSNNDGIDDVLSLLSDFLVIYLFRIGLFSGLLLVCLHWYEVDSDIVVGESLEDIDLLSGSELWFLVVFLVQQLLFRVTEEDESVVKFLFWDGTVLLDLSVC